MRLYAPVLACAALASGCGNDKPKPPPQDPVAAKPVDPSLAAKPACDDRHAVIEAKFRVRTRVELVCDAAGKRVRFMDDDITVEETQERALTDAEWDAAWKAIDATNWAALPESCGKLGDQGSQTIEVTAGGKTKNLICVGMELSAAHEALIDALMAPAKPLTDAVDKEAAQAVRDALWLIEVGRAGPVRVGMSLAALRAIPDIKLKTVTVEVPIELEDSDEMATEQIERIEVWFDGEHQLTVDTQTHVNDDRTTEERISGIEVVGALVRVTPTADEFPAGVGTSAQELQDRYGAPSEFEPIGVWSKLACAMFEKQRAVKFCFDTKSKSFEQVRKKNLPVERLDVRQ
jgi:hypothetical protein